MASSNLLGEEIQSSQLGFRHPFTMIVSGSTGSGKSEWILRLFKNFRKLIIGNGEAGPSPIDLILYCYGELNPNILQMQRRGKIEDGEIRLLTYHGFPSEELLRTHAKQTNGHLLVVLDDLMTGIGGNKDFMDSLFTRASHNWGVSVVLVTQHLFTKELRIPRNNSHYIVLLRNPAGALQIRNLAVQLFPSKVPYFLEAYSDAIRKNFGYLLIDIHPATVDSLRLRTNIYSDDGQPTTVYLPK
jgi:hypothetical protein